MSRQVTDPKDLLPHECGAERNDGFLCTASAMRNGKCRKHGGRAGAGPATPYRPMSRHSKRIPKRMRDGYEASLRDPELLSARADIALMDARIGELTSRLSNKDNADRWKMLKANWDAFLYALTVGDDAEQKRCLQMNGKLINGAMKYEALWDSLYQAIERRSSIAQREQKRVIEMREVLSLEQGVAFVNALTKIVMRHVVDPAIRRRIADEMNEVVNMPEDVEPPIPVNAVITKRDLESDDAHTDDSRDETAEHSGGES